MGTEDEKKGASGDLSDLYQETRILLPGSQVFLGFLATVPFTDGFARLSHPLRLVFVAAFVSAFAAVVLLVAPAAYHRSARPIQDKHAFKLFANALVRWSLLPLSFGIVLVVLLVVAAALGQGATSIALVIASASLVVAAWWLLPALRVHELMGGPRRGRSRPDSTRGSSVGA